MKRRQIKRVFWGVLFLLGALALLLEKLGYLNGLGFWSVFVSVILAGFLINGILIRSFGEMLFSLAMLVIVNDELLHLEAVTPWPVLGAALLGTIGLNIIFPGRKRWKNHPDTRCLPESVRYEDMNGEVIDGENIRYSVSFGEAIKYVSGQDISLIHLDNSFGHLAVYFNDAVLKDNRAKAVVDCSFGDMELYVPDSWNLVLNVRSSFGGVEETGCGDPDGADTLLIEGDVSFAVLKIHYIKL